MFEKRGFTLRPALLFVPSDWLQTTHHGTARTSWEHAPISNTAFHFHAARDTSHRERHHGHLNNTPLRQRDWFPTTAPLPPLTSVLQGRSRLHLSYQASRFPRKASISAGSLKRCRAGGGAGAGAGAPARRAARAQGTAGDGEGLRGPTAAPRGQGREPDTAAAGWTSTECRALRGRSKHR